MTKIKIRARINEFLNGMKAKELRDVLEYIEGRQETREILADKAAMKRLAEAEKRWNNGDYKPGDYVEWEK